MAEWFDLIPAILSDPPPADRPKASPGLPGDAAAPSFVMAASPPAPTPAASFIERPAPRCAMIAALALIVAAVVAFAAVKFSQLPASTSVTASTGSPPPSRSPTQKHQAPVTP